MTGVVHIVASRNIRYDATNAPLPWIAVLTLTNGKTTLRAYASRLEAENVKFVTDLAA